MKEEEGEGDGDNGEVEGRRRRSGGRPTGRRRPGVDHMVAIFYKCVVNLRKINSNWENKRNYHLCTVIGDLQNRKVVEDLISVLKAVIRRWFWNKSKSIFKIILLERSISRVTLFTLYHPYYDTLRHTIPPPWTHSTTPLPTKIPKNTTTRLNQHFQNKFTEIKNKIFFSPTSCTRNTNPFLLPTNMLQILSLYWINLL